MLKQHPIATIVALLSLILIGAVAVKVFENETAGKESLYGSQETLVVTQPVRMAEFIDEIEAIGTARANESVNLTSKLTETVSHVSFEDGMYVSEGDILVELTNAEETAQLAEAQATVDEARQQYDRLVNLVDQKLAPQTQLDEERARFHTAEARLDAIMARLNDRLIRAPFSGLLGFRNVSTGTLLTTNHVITTLDDIDRIKLDFTISEAYLLALQPGLEIQAISSAYPGHSFRGVVATVNSRVDAITRAVTVRAIVANEERLLRPGMLLKVRLIRSSSQLRAVPEESLVPVGEDQFVFVVDNDMTAKRVKVIVGRRQAGLVEISSDLPVGTQVITEGIIRVRPGAKVKIRQAT